MKRRNERNSGFTLLETLVTVAVLVILLGLSLVGVARWRDPLKITELDNEAREIYMAAENRAVLLQNSGEADNVMSKLPDSNKQTVTVDGEGKSVIVLCNKNDNDKAALESLIPTGTIDPYLWEGKFYVLYDAETFHVYEVFYAEKEFNAAKLNDLRQDKDTRIQLYRSGDVACLVGHYDNGLADKIATKPMPAPGVEVIIENGNQLLLTVKYTMPKNADLPSGVEIGDVKREANVTLEYPNPEDPDKPFTVNMMEDKCEPPNIKDIDTAGAGKIVTYTWVLDSLDCKDKNDYIENHRFKDLFNDNNMPSKGLGGDFTVTASLRLSAKGCIESFYSAEDSDNSLFDTSTHDGETAYIANLRHLQNLDNAYSLAAGKKKAVQLVDIDCKDYKGNDGEVLGENYEFVPIVNWDLFSYDAGCTDDKDNEGDEVVPHSIKNLKVTANSAIGRNSAGLFGAAQVDFKFCNIRLVDCEITGGKGQSAGAIMGYSWNPAIFENCQVISTNVTSGSYAGGMAGDVSKATFTNCTAKKVTVKGESFTGGLIGNMLYTFEFENCRVVEVEAESTNGVVGGMAGYTWSGNITFKDCAAEGPMEIKGLSAGGLMGSEGDSGTVTFDGCTVGKDGKESITIEGSSSNGGGIVGNTDGKATFKNCTVGYESGVQTDKKVVITASAYAGGLSGNSIIGTFENCNVFNAQVGYKGKKTTEAGGLVGRTEGWNNRLEDWQQERGVKFYGCVAKDLVIEANSNAGGLVGGAIDVIMGPADGKSCIAENVTVIANDSGGGIVGNSTRGQFTECKAVNTRVDAVYFAGGLVGTVQFNYKKDEVYVPVPEGAKATNLNGCQVYLSNQSLSYLQGYLINSQTAGGLVGAIKNMGKIQNSFAATSVNGSAYAGGLVGSLPTLEAGSGTSDVSITKSYADCRLYAGSSGLQWSTAGGLIGLKENGGILLMLENVYAAGFIKIDTGSASGLCGGGSTTEINTYIKYAYAAMHYQNAGTIFPLAGNKLVEPSYPNDHLYYMENSWGGGQGYNGMLNIDMGPAFEKKSVADSHPYDNNLKNNAYPFPGLVGLPHYGDWYVPEKTVMAEPPLEEAGPGPEAGSPEQSTDTEGAVEGEPSEAAPPAGDITAAEQSIPAGEPGTLPPDTSSGRSGRSVTKRDP